MEKMKNEMNFFEHLEEFRWTLAKSCLAFFIGIFVVFIFMRDISGFLQLPLLKAYGSYELLQKNLITYRPMGVISVFIQVAFLGGFFFAMPFILYFLANFIAPGLEKKEKAILKPSCFGAFFLFAIGVLFSFYIILPLTLGFSVRLNDFLGFDLLWAASDYYNLVVWFCLATGIFFQFPLIIVTLVYLKVFPVSILKSNRRSVFLGLMIFSALISPGGDFISLPLMTMAMYGLYEFSILISNKIDKRQLDAELDKMDDV